MTDQKLKFIILDFRIRSMCSIIFFFLDRESILNRVKFIKFELKRLFHTNGKFRLFYRNRHIKSRHKLSYYGITSNESNIELTLI